MAVERWFTAADRDAPDSPLVELWPGSLDLSTEALEVYLQAAAAQCSEYAPAVADGEPVPSAYRLAQTLQARALSRAGTIGVADTDGMLDTVTVFPMDWTVKALLRPRVGIPRIH